MRRWNRSFIEEWRMSPSRRSLAGLAVVALLFAACSSSGSSLAPLVAPTGVNASSAAAAGAPPAPTDFTATRKSGSVPCPRSAETCSETDLAWQSTAAAGTWFKIYSTGTGEDPAATCLSVQSQAVSKLNSKPDARNAQVFDPMAVGAGQACWWITAVNGSGESAQVPAASNSSSTAAQSAAPEGPAAPTGFTATRKSGSVACPSPDPNGGSCSQTDFAWQASADPETGFRIYVVGTGEGGGATCVTEQPNATVALELAPNLRSARAFDPIATGGGQICYWITAVSSTGESEQVPAAGN
jgi:hypothetical protein